MQVRRPHATLRPRSTNFARTQTPIPGRWQRPARNHRCWKRVVARFTIDRFLGLLAGTAVLAILTIALVANCILGLLIFQFGF